MVANDNACLLDNCGVVESIASKLAPTGNGLLRAYSQSQPLEEIAQQLVAARAIVGVAELAEQRAQLRLGHRELGGLEDRVHVVFLSLIHI